MSQVASKEQAETVEATRLAKPDERPGSIVIIYDGHCRFCTAQVQRLARWDDRQCLSFLSLHDAEVAQRYPDLTHEQLMEQMYAIDADGRRYGGAAAFRLLTRKLPRLWPLVPLLHLPLTLPLWQWAYRQVALRRYRMGHVDQPCDGDACRVHFGGNRGKK